jgi:hypothetical protein
MGGESEGGHFSQGVRRLRHWQGLPHWHTRPARPFTFEVRHEGGCPAVQGVDDHLAVHGALWVGGWVGGSGGGGAASARRVDEGGGLGGWAAAAPSPPLRRSGAPAVTVLCDNARCAVW